MKKLIFTLVAIFWLNTSAYCQTALSQTDLEAFKDRIGMMIDTFQSYLSILGSKEKSPNVKKSYKQQTLELFIGDGEPYKDIETGELQPAVSMEVSALRNGIESKRKLPMKKYLDNLIALPYVKVEITSAGTYHLSNLHPVGDHYEATAFIFQKFCGYGADGRKKYCDTTKKVIKIYLIPEEDIRGVHWTVKFGDISVGETSN